MSKAVGFVEMAYARPMRQSHKAEEGCAPFLIPSIRYPLCGMFTTRDTKLSADQTMVLAHNRSGTPKSRAPTQRQLNAHGLDRAYEEAESCWNLDILVRKA